MRSACLETTVITNNLISNVNLKDTYVIETENNSSLDCLYCICGTVYRDLTYNW